MQPEILRPFLFFSFVVLFYRSGSRVVEFAFCLNVFVVSQGFAFGTGMRLTARLPVHPWSVYIGRGPEL